MAPTTQLWCSSESPSLMNITALVASLALTHWPHICPSEQRTPHRGKKRGGPGLAKGPWEVCLAIDYQAYQVPSPPLDLSTYSPGSCEARKPAQILGDGGKDRLCLPQGEIGLGSVLNSLTPELAMGWRSSVQRLRPEVTVRCQRLWTLQELAHSHVLSQWLIQTWAFL